nr:DEAD-box ATP-dependent RNA helicase 21 [Tanacetum cinerariifolium]
MRDRVREEKTTPREQRHARRDKVREAENKLKKKDTIINQTHAKKREREVEVESINESFRTTGSGVESSLNNKLLKATPSPIQMAAIPLGSQQSDVIGVAETGSGKVPVGNLYVLLLVRLIVPVGRLSVAFPAVFTFY